MNEATGVISKKILFVDDEVLILEGIKRQLRREFDITVAEGGQAALSTLATEGPFAVVVSDYNMPSMDGITFLKAVSQNQPDAVLVMLTGRADLDIAVNALHNAHIARFLNKPCPKEIIQETLNDCLEQYRLRISEQLLQAQLQQANQQLNQINENLEILVAQKTHDLQLQYGYVASMANMASSQAIIDAFILAVRQLTGRHKITLWLSPQQNGNFICHFPNDHGLEKFSGAAQSSGIVADTLRHKNRWLHGTSGSPIDAFDYSTFNGQPLLCQPLLGKHGVVGLLNISDDGAGDLDQGTLEALAGMTDVTATALQSHWHKEAFAEAQDAIITALAKLSEYRDPETGAHLQRLKKYSRLICKYLAGTDKYANLISPEFSEDLARSSPLHDIGKVGIPDAILKKPGRLTEEEFEIMQTHAQIGGDTLRSVYEQYPSQSFIKCGMEVAYCHHEKWNGSGYPQGLVGDAIPLSARILALADVYDALTCQRVYKAPFPRERARDIIIESRGTHFDPDIVDAFLGMESEFHQIAQQFADIV